MKAEVGGTHLAVRAQTKGRKMPNFGIWEWLVIAGCCGSAIVVPVVAVIVVLLLARKSR